MTITIKDSRVELDVIQYEDQTKYNIMVSIVKKKSYMY